uniref:Uncharacterized protein n=1 Tax=Tanacetum cinerariifolium TaxID=118510 RepID=A0A6L2MS09_TANCI|nr:hypothetical protein [Tanacetum cinerariifolium]
MDHTNPTFAKIPILDTRKFEQWKFRIQQYLQNKHYALWEVIEFSNSYKAPPEETGKGLASESSAKKKGRAVVITTEDMQKRRNDVKARTTLLLALPDEHQLRFSKYETTKELWEAILKTFGGNEATKKTKKNQLKQQYGNFKAEGSETLEQTFNRLQAIVSHLEFMDVEIKQDDLNQKFLTSLAPEWLIVYEPEFQKKSESNSQNMAFISSSNTSSGKSEVSTTSVPTASTQVSTASTNVAALSLSHDTIWPNDEVPTEFALMAKSSSSSDNEVYDDSNCSKSCRKNTENLNTKISKLNEELSNCETDLYNYKRGLSQVEARLVEFKEHEVKFCEKNRGLERDVDIRDNKIKYLKNELEQKRRQHKASCKTKLVNSISKPLHTLHMDLFGPTSVNSLNHKWYCLVVIDDFSRPFGCHVMILNTLDHLGKFDAKGDAGYFVGYSLSSKAFMVFNKRTKKVEENLHVDFLENKLIEKGAGPNWLFDIDTLTNSMNYVPVVVAGTSSTNISGTKDVASQYVKKDVTSLKYIALPNYGISNPTATSKVPSAEQVEPTVSLTVEYEIPTVSSPVPTVCLDISPESSSGPRLITKGDFTQKETPSLGNALTLSNRFEDTFRVEADLSNMEISIPVSPTPTFRIHKDHPKSQIISPVDTPVQTKHKFKDMGEQSFIATIHQKTNLELLQFYLFSCFLSQEEPKKIFDALKDPSWVEVMQEELLQFKIQNVWVLVDCPKGVRPIDTKWVLKNKKDEKGIVIRNKARLVAQGYTQEEGC